MPAATWLESHPAYRHTVISPLRVSLRSVHPGNMTKVSSSWNCTVCGNWRYQNTADGDPPNEWAIGERPADWPAK